MAAPEATIAQTESVVPIKTDEKLELIVDQNPFHQKLEFVVKGEPGSAKVSLVDLLGRTVIERDVLLNENIRLETPVAVGIYLLRVEHKDGVLTRRLLKE